jgi:nicotinamidase-related amidase
MANALLVTDMVVGFLEDGHNLYCGDEARSIIPNVQALIARERAAGSAVFFICDNHDPNDLEFQMFPVHCVRGTEEPQVIAELDVREGEYVPKKRYSGFFGTDLEARLAELKPEKVIVCGVCTDICVLHTTADARNRDYPVEVPVDCVASFNPEAHRNALEHIEKILGARLVQTAPAAQ